MRRPNEILKAFLLEESLTGEELILLQSKMSIIAELCEEFGEVFMVHGIYARSVSEECAREILRRKRAK